ncbi:MAG: hypothetical protein WCS51_02875 [Bacilli bacterium]|jgi:hypothetical protein
MKKKEVKYISLKDLKKQKENERYDGSNKQYMYNTDFRTYLGR